VPYFASTDRTLIHFTDWGDPDGKPLVLVHGYGSDQRMWGSQIAAFLDAGLRCITYDRRGHGRSDVPGRGYDLDTLATDLAALVDHLELRDVVLVGQSLGGAEVIRCASAHVGDRTAGLVLSAPSSPTLRRTPDNPTGMDDALLDAARRAMAADVGAVVEAIDSKAFFGPGHTVSALLADAARRQFVDLPLPVLLATFDTNANVDLRDDLARLTTPTLVIHGDADVNNPLDLTGRPTAALVPGARLAVLEGAGHGLYWSAAARFNAEVLDFVHSLGGRP
jgi:non-heme chloroperoxidase